MKLVGPEPWNWMDYRRTVKVAEVWVQPLFLCKIFCCVPKCGKPSTFSFLRLERLLLLANWRVLVGLTKLFGVELQAPWSEVAVGWKGRQR